MRGAERPVKTKWNRPFPGPLAPLSDTAVHRMFYDIADGHHEPSKVQQLLELTGNLPLAVGLMAGVVGYEGCDRTLSRWSKENTLLLSDAFKFGHLLDSSQ
jgi:hypothetical protein